MAKRTVVLVLESKEEAQEMSAAVQDAMDHFDNGSSIKNGLRKLAVALGNAKFAK